MKRKDGQKSQRLPALSDNNFRSANILRNIFAFHGSDDVRHTSHHPEIERMGPKSDAKYAPFLFYLCSGLVHNLGPASDLRLDELRSVSRCHPIRPHPLRDELIL